MNLPVFVINLPADNHRWEALSSSAAAHAAHFALHRVEAIDGRLMAPQDRQGVDVAAFNRNGGRDMLPGEYGCYRSHLRALEQFLADGAPCGLILEDDVVFRPDSAARIEAILAAAPDFGVIKLVNHRTRLLIGLSQTQEGDTVGRAIHGPQGSAAAYLVSRAGARRLLEAIAIMALPWDVALERSWSHGATVLTTKQNVLDFSDHRQKSNISIGGYRRTKYPWYRRLGTASARTRDYLARTADTLRYPAAAMESMRQAGGNETARRDEPAAPAWMQYAAAIAILLFTSAVWHESDAYRYAGLALFVAALVHYFRRSLWYYEERPFIGWAGIICLAWVACVAIRIAVSYIFFPEYGAGASEGIYLLPIFYSTFGFALLLYVRRPFVLATAFIAISALVLTFGVDYSFVLQSRSASLLHNNSIHASVGAGLIALCCVPFGLHVARRPDLERATRLALALLAAVTFLLALTAVYTLQSKGVWLALAAALPLLAVLLFVKGGGGGRTARAVALACVLVAMAGVAANYEMMRRVGGPTLAASFALASDIIAGNGVINSLDKAITETATPASMRQRLMLWANALYIWRDNPVFGAGVAWLHEWQDRRYQHTSYTVIHNGYLEIAVRYGWSGLGFYAFLFFWSLRRVWQATRAGLIDATAFQCYAATAFFFAVTMLSNSNNRLAIGESFMWLGAGFGFYCYYLLQQRAVLAPKTII